MSVSQPDLVHAVASSQSIVTADHPYNDSTAAHSLHSVDVIAKANSSGPMISVGDIETTLRSAKDRKAFETFLEQHFCAENLNFWIAVEEYRACGANEPKRASLAKRIYETFCSVEATSPVNVDCKEVSFVQRIVNDSQTQRVKAAVDSNEFPETLFDNGQNQIFHLLRHDIWPRYCKWQQQQQRDQGGGKASNKSKTASTSSSSSGCSRRPNLLEKIIGSVGTKQPPPQPAQASAPSKPVATTAADMLTATSSSVSPTGRHHRATASLSVTGRATSTTKTAVQDEHSSSNGNGGVATAVAESKGADWKSSKQSSMPALVIVSVALWP